MLHIAPDSLDPFANLALEDILFSNLKPDHPGIFMLWRNSPCVILGRNQCANDELNLDYIKQNGIAVCRRTSGGGAVYQDEGNLNFSFITHVNKNTAAAQLPYLEAIASKLRGLGINAVISGRNDLLAAGKKIAGCAFRFQGKKALIHGSLLVNCNLEAMNLALTPSYLKLAGKGIASCRSRTANLAELRKGLTMAEVIACFGADYEKTDLSPEVLAQAEFMARIRFGLDAWIYGSTLPKAREWRRKFPFGEIIYKFAINDNGFEYCRIEGDFFSMRELTELETALVKTAFDQAALLQTLKKMDLGQYFYGCDPLEVAQFLASAAPEQDKSSLISFILP